MLNILKSADRGQTKNEWLNSWHSFSFADYHNPKQVHFSVLRVINEDIIAPGMGFAPHSHRDMEIITFIIEGALEHQDSMGNTGIIKPYEVQVMSAGEGVTHSEYNHLQDQATHLLQIWIFPDEKSLSPSYEQKSFVEEFKKNNLILIASNQAKNGALKIHQDVNLYLGRCSAEEKLLFNCAPDRHVWLQMIKGKLQVNNLEVMAGDGVAISKENSLDIVGLSNAEFLLFDLV